MGAEISKKIKLTGGWGFRASETLLLSQNWNRYTQKHIGLTGQLLDSTSPLPLHKCRGFPQRALTASTATRAGGQGAVPTQLWQSGKPCCSPAVQAFVIPFANNPCFTAAKTKGSLAAGITAAWEQRISDFCVFPALIGKGWNQQIKAIRVFLVFTLSGTEQLSKPHLSRTLHLHPAQPRPLIVYF